MGVERDIIDEAGKRGVRLTVGAPVPWLTARGHLDPLVQREAPAEILEVLDDLHRDLGGDLRALARKQLGAPTPDLVVVGSGQIVEVDEVQHFTADRLTSLGRYPSRFVPGFSFDDYRVLIAAWKAKANAVFTRQWSPDFDFAGGRRAHRAYCDALIDLLAPIFTGYPVVRLAMPGRDARAAVGSLLVVAA